jgi:putative ABC transport system permease protein
LRIPFDAKECAKRNSEAEVYAILRQVKANVRSHKLQSALICLTLFAAATLLTMALITLHTARGGYHRLFKRTHGAHLWLYLEPGRVTAEEAQAALTDLPGVEASTGVMSTLFPALYAGEELMKSEEVREWPGEAAAVARSLLVAGRAPEPGEKRVIVLDRNVAALFGKDVGDTIDLGTPDGRHSLAVVGLQIGSGFCPFPSCQPGLNYVAPGTLADLGQLLAQSPGVEGLVVGLRARDPSDVRALATTVAERLPPESIVTWRDWKEILRLCDESVLLQKILFAAFSLMAGLAAGFLIANTIGGAVRAQTRQIGLLKAVGLVGRQLAQVYLLEYLGLALIASLTGLVAGSVLAAAILRPVAVRFGEPLARPPLWAVLVTPVSTLLVSAVFTLGSTRRAVRMGAVQAIRFGAERPRRRAAHLLRIPLPLAIGLSDVLSCPLSSVLTILGLGVTVVTLTFALSAVETSHVYANDPAWGDLYVRSNLPDEEVRRLLAGQSKVAAYYAERVESFQFSGDEEVLQARFREGDLQAFQFALVEGRMPQRPDEVVVSYVLARERGLEPGKSTTILVEGQPCPLQVVGVYREQLNLGRMLILSLDTWRLIHPEAEPSYYSLALAPGTDAGTVAQALEADSADCLKVDRREPSGAMNTLPKSMALLSLVLSILAVVGVLNTAWMGVQERRRELGLLKAAGMTPGQVTLSVLAGAAGMAVMGYVAGLAIGLPTVHLLFDILGRAMFYGPLNASVDAVGQVLLFPGIVLLAVVAALLPARRAGRVSVIETLRYE